MYLMKGKRRPFIIGNKITEAKEQRWAWKWHVLGGAGDGLIRMESLLRE